MHHPKHAPENITLITEAVKVIQLIETQKATELGNSWARRYYANGKRVSHEEFQGIKNRSKSLDCIQSVSSGGARTFYTLARIESGEGGHAGVAHERERF